MRCAPEYARNDFSPEYARGALPSTQGVVWMDIYVLYMVCKSKIENGLDTKKQKISRGRKKRKKKALLCNVWEKFT